MTTRLVAALAGTVLALGTATSAAAAPASAKDNLNSRTDSDRNGYPDVGQVVSGQQRLTQDFGDTTCDYFLHYRGEFDNDAYQDTGWIQNVITCEGAEPGHYQYLIVHQSDPRYTGEGTPVWGEWEYHVQTESGVGNLERVQRVERP